MSMEFQLAVGEPPGPLVHDPEHAVQPFHPPVDGFALPRVVGVQAWVLADDLPEVVEPPENPLACRSPVRDAVQGNLETSVPQV